MLVRNIRGTSVTPFAQSAKPYLSNYSYLEIYIYLWVYQEAWF